MRVSIPDCELEHNDDYQRWLFEVQRAEWEAEMREEQERNKEDATVETC